MGTRYDRGIFKHNQELILRCEKLAGELEHALTEICSLKAEVKYLNERATKLNEKVENLEGENATLKAENAMLKDITRKQAEEIERLRAQINKDSSNSSKPPSSNGFKKPPNNREKSGKKQGGQYGHKGKKFTIPHNLGELVAQKKAEHVVIMEVAEGEPYTSDWEVDIKIIPVYTETRRAKGAIERMKYGRGVATIATYLSMVGLVAVERLSVFFKDITNGLITVSKATIQNSISKAAGRVDINELTEDLLNGKIMNVDETPIRTTERGEEEKPEEKSEEKLEDSSKGTSKKVLTAYIRTYSNARTTLLTANAHKDIKSVEDDKILTQYWGIVVQDYEVKFLRYGSATALCGAHLTRELRGLAELERVGWAQKFREFLLGMCAHKNEDLSREQSACDAEVLCEFEVRYDALVAEGEVCLQELNKQSYVYNDVTNMVKRLRTRKNEYMRFIRDYSVPFTNNQAERDLRHCKTKQKISGCFRSWIGVEDYCKLRSFIDTARKRRANLIEQLSLLVG